jgi:hypothetical protein
MANSLNKASGSIFEYLDVYFTNNPEKTHKIISILVLNLLPDLTASLISRLRDEGLTHEAISKKFTGNFGKGTIYKLQNKHYFPKNEKKQIALLKNVLDSL